MGLRKVIPGGLGARSLVCLILRTQLMPARFDTIRSRLISRVWFATLLCTPDLVEQQQFIWPNGRFRGSNLEPCIISP